jgi:hypothetical protein
MRIRTLSISLPLLSLPACEGLFDVAGAPGTSRLEFQHSGFAGGGAGVYRAVGEVTVNPGSTALGDWAYAELTGIPEPLTVQIVASRTAEGGRFDVATILLPADAQAGERITFLEMCETSPLCGDMAVDLGLLSAGGIPETRCWMRHGELRLRTRTARRVAGTFNGTAVCASGVAETQITDGEFDVALLDPDPVG